MAIPHTLKFVFLTLSGTTLGARVARSIDSSDKLEVWTFGAPKISLGSLTFKDGACIPGYRVVNENFDENETDMVTWLQMTTKHPKMKTLRLGENSSMEENCDWKRTGKVSPLISLHDGDVYTERSMTHRGAVAIIADIVFSFSYESDILDGVKERGLELVGSANRGGEVSHLIQHPPTGECILTFEGSDTIQDWKYNLNLKKTNFCGIGGIHQGFVESLRNILEAESWQDNIRKNLGKCSRLAVVGHSLGGAMAALWAVCAQANRPLNSDYKSLSFPVE